MGAGYYLTGWIRHRAPTVGWHGREKAKRSFKKIWFPLPLRGLKRLVKNLSKRSEQQQQLPVRSLVTLTVKEWVRSQMNTLFWDFCKINNTFQVWKEGEIFCFNIQCLLYSQSLPHRLLWYLRLSYLPSNAITISTSLVGLKWAQNESNFHIPHDRIIAGERLSDKSSRSPSSNLSNLSKYLQVGLQ